ncbi:hypothetical protein [Streptomyces sp. NPDC046925]|uniref:hypothetical protein n=1 Tax=Streptomyces sp. NPDC046925 TaxID=3155375 RepID=UPI0033EA9E10
MTSELERFIRIYLHYEQAQDVRGDLRSTLHAFNASFVAGVRDGLEKVLRTRELSVAGYERLTDVEFGDEDALYDYLDQMRQYLFADRADQPLPPE